MGRTRSTPWPPKAEFAAHFEKGLRLQDVAAHYGYSVGWVSYLRKQYGLVTRPRDQVLFVETPPLQGELLEFFLGSMLGDGCLLQHTKGHVKFVEKHSEAQKGYVEWKRQQWGARASKLYRGPSQQYLGHTGRRLYGGRETWGFTTAWGRDFEFWNQEFYDGASVGERRKEFPRSMLKHASALMIAVWFMDDGAILDGYYPGFACHLKSHDVGTELLASVGVMVEPNDQNTGMVVKTRDDADRLYTLIEPHIHPDLAYKLDTPCLLNDPRRRITFDEDEVRRLVEVDGLTRLELEREMGWGHKYTGYVLLEYGISPRKPEARSASVWVEPDLAHEVEKHASHTTGGGRKKFFVRKEVFLQLIEEGVSKRRMAARLGVKENVVCRMMKDYGIEYDFWKEGVLLPRECRVPRDQLEKLVNEGLPRRELARRFKCAFGTIGVKLKEYGLSTKGGWTHRVSGVDIEPPIEDEERWEDVVGFPEYRVSTHGRVMSFRRRKPRILSYGGHRDGTSTVTLMRWVGCPADGGHNFKKRYVHHLVLEAFVRLREPGEEARHLNRIKNDNRLENLVWGSPDTLGRRKRKRDEIPESERKPLPGTGPGFAKGEACSSAKLTEAKVRAIRTSPLSQAELAANYNVGVSTISAVQTRRTWAHVKA